MNQFGKEPVDLYIACSLRILNWRTRWDLQGNFTYYSFIGSSTVDLVLVSEYTLANIAIIQYLSVFDLSYFFDHN